MKREQCTFYLSFYNSIVALPAKYRGEAALTIIEYLLFEQEPKLPEEHPIKAMFEMGRPGFQKQINKAKCRNKSDQPADKPEQTEIKSEQKISNQSTTPICPNISQSLESITNIFSQSLNQKKLDQNELKILFDLIFDEIEVKKDVSDFGEDAVLAALRKAKKNGAKYWAYVHACLTTKGVVRQPAEFQRHGAEISPMMQEAAKKLVEADNGQAE